MNNGLERALNVEVGTSIKSVHNSRGAFASLTVDRKYVVEGVIPIYRGNGSGVANGDGLKDVQFLITDNLGRKVSPSCANFEY